MPQGGRHGCCRPGPADICIIYIRLFLMGPTKGGAPWDSLIIQMSMMFEFEKLTFFYILECGQWAFPEIAKWLLPNVFKHCLFMCCMKGNFHSSHLNLETCISDVKALVFLVIAPKSPRIIADCKCTNYRQARHSQSQSFIVKWHG